MLKSVSGIKAIQNDVKTCIKPIQNDVKYCIKAIQTSDVRPSISNLICVKHLPKKYKSVYKILCKKVINIAQKFVIKGH